MATVAELKKELDDRGVEYASDAKKPELEKLVADSAVADPTDTDPNASTPNDIDHDHEDAPGVGEEGPTELGDPDYNTDPIPDVGGPQPVPPGFEEPGKGDHEVLDPISHNGVVYPVGVAAPKDLSDEQVARLKRLGAIK